MSKIKVIISPGHAFFEPNQKYESILKQKGHQGWASLQARTDKNIIEFIEKHIDGDHKIALVGKTEYGTGYVKIVEVDTSIPWIIESYDNSEYIHYIDFKIIDKNLNYAKYK